MPPTAVVQKWSRYYVIDRTRNLPGTAATLHTHLGAKLIVTSADGVPSFTVLDDDLAVIAPATLLPPNATVERFSANAGVLHWTDVQGANEFVIERRIGQGGAWQPVATVAAGVTRYNDSALMAGAVNYYRVQAKNRALVSAWSNEVSLDLTGPPPVRVDPRTVEFLPDDVFIGIDGRVYVFSRTHHSIFVWHTQTQDWGVTIPLIGDATHVAYSPAHHSLYVGYASGMVNSVRLTVTAPSEVPLAQLPEAVCSLAAAGPMLITCDHSGAWVSNRSFDAAGVQLDWSEWRSPFHGGAWNASRSALFHFRDSMSPNDLMRTTVEADGRLGQLLDSPYHGEVYATYPIRISPNGDRVYLGSGQVFDADTLLLATPSMPGAFTDLAWRGDQMLSASGPVISEHHSTTLAASPGLTMAHTVKRLLPSPGGWVIVTTSATQTFLTLADNALEPIEPPLFYSGFE